MLHTHKPSLPLSCTSAYDIYIHAGYTQASSTSPSKPSTIPLFPLPSLHPPTDTDRFVIEELEALRQRSQMQEQQIDRQQAIIVQLQQKLNTAASQPLQPQASGVVRVTGRLPSSANMGGAPVASTSGSRPGSSLLPPKSPAGINQPPAPMSGSRPGSSIRPGSQPRQGNPASRGSGGGISIPSIDGRPPSVTTLPPIESQFMATADDHGGQDESEYSEEEDGVMPGPAMSAEVTTIARDDESL